jgi:hypothetical protein
MLQFGKPTGSGLVLRWQVLKSHLDERASSSWLSIVSACHVLRGDSIRVSQAVRPVHLPRFTFFWVLLTYNGGDRCCEAHQIVFSIQGASRVRKIWQSDKQVLQLHKKRYAGDGARRHGKRRKNAPPYILPYEVRLSKIPEFHP